tara:strand:- start:90 stop:401 length:312 start_codon:yes stop_codon:yes gene_type:complete
MEGKYLITTDGWFTGPDGKEYKAVWGTVEIMSDSILGVTTNRNSANWFAKVGSEANHIIIAGCQIHYACKCEQKPFTENSEIWESYEGETKIYQAPTRIYIAE